MSGPQAIGSDEKAQITSRKAIGGIDTGCSMIGLLMFGRGVVKVENPRIGTAGNEPGDVVGAPRRTRTQLRSGRNCEAEDCPTTDRSPMRYRTDLGCRSAPPGSCEIHRQPQAGCRRRTGTVRVPRSQPCGDPIELLPLGHCNHSSHIFRFGNHIPPKNRSSTTPVVVPERNVDQMWVPNGICRLRERQPRPRFLRRFLIQQLHSIPCRVTTAWRGDRVRPIVPPC